MSTGIRRSTRMPVDARAWAARLGFTEVTTVPADPPKVGDQALVYGRGDWRLGTITKVGRTTIYVAVSTPTSPHLITTARIGGRWSERGYLKAISRCYFCRLTIHAPADSREIEVLPGERRMAHLDCITRADNERRIGA